MDWKEITEDTKEKYGLYLCSREWSELREAVRRRSDGTCERCRRNPMDAVHHLTYARKYAERLEDLQAICTPCHEFTHGKSNEDPAEEETFESVDVLGTWATGAVKVGGVHHAIGTKSGDEYNRVTPPWQLMVFTEGGSVVTDDGCLIGIRIQEHPGNDCYNDEYESLDMDMALSAKECRKLAEWLLKFACQEGK